MWRGCGGAEGVNTQAQGQHLVAARRETRTGGFKGKGQGLGPSHQTGETGGLDEEEEASFGVLSLGHLGTSTGGDWGGHLFGEWNSSSGHCCLVSMKYEKDK